LHTMRVSPDEPVIGGHKKSWIQIRSATLIDPLRG
jgi:hypothetical protein